MLQLSWTIEGEKQLSRRLKGIRADVKDWSSAFKASAKYLKETFSTDVFNTQGKAIGEKWMPLKPSTQAAKNRRYPGKGPLVASGKMKGSFETLYKTDMAAVWNSTAYFKYHQSNQPRNKLPRRVMMKLGNQQREVIVKIFHTHFRKKIK